ncbi:hypothetical protein [Candidatus Poriferisodalis sp.]|uniref:hypothetical protein n=1 Tax=Candidatus Poriferisodalis sp. TaxID=3101277 RepID=UPI003B5A9EC6
MALSDSEKKILREAGSERDPVSRQQAVGIVLAKQGEDADEARELLTQGYLEHVSPSFHLVPRGDSMFAEDPFTEAYAALAEGTDNFADVSSRSLATTLLATPAALAPLRMILGLTHNELAFAIRLQVPDSRVDGGRLKNFERDPPPRRLTAARERLVDSIAEAVLAMMKRELLPVPPRAATYFHSKLDKRDTLGGWESVRGQTAGVPYSALLFQRYVGGVWRQVQDAYSEVKGDAILEFPLRDLLDAHAVPYHRTKRGASGAAETAERFGVKPGPDFVIPDESPTLVVESKVAEDGGTVRDKAARIRTLSDAASGRGLKACVLIDGKGWTERPNALCDVVLATQGRTYTLATIEHILELPEIRALTRGRA